MATEEVESDGAESVESAGEDEEVLEGFGDVKEGHIVGGSEDGFEGGE